jgi:hypothetical protein
MIASSSCAVERRVPSASELSLIRSLRDQLKNAQHQLKIVTAKVDVALSKALRAMDAEKILLEEIKSLGKAMKCELISHKYRGSCVAFSISKSVEPNKELKVG